MDTNIHTDSLSMAAVAHPFLRSQRAAGRSFKIRPFLASARKPGCRHAALGIAQTARRTANVGGEFGGGVRALWVQQGCRHTFFSWACMHKATRGYTHTHTHGQTQTHPQAHARAHCGCNKDAATHFFLGHACIKQRADTHTHTHKQTHTNTNTHTHTHTHGQTQTHPCVCMCARLPRDGDRDGRERQREKETDRQTERKRHRDRKPEIKALFGWILSALGRWAKRKSFSRLRAATRRTWPLPGCVPGITQTSC